MVFCSRCNSAIDEYRRACININFENNSYKRILYSGMGYIYRIEYTIQVNKCRCIYSYIKDFLGYFVFGDWISYFNIRLVCTMLVYPIIKLI